MNRAVFFDVVRKTFGNKLDKDQVSGITSLLDAGDDLPLHHMANVLANVRHETGGIMAPIKETVMPWHKNRRPSDSEVIHRLDASWLDGKLPSVDVPYWRGGYFGRGQIQITHLDNYYKFGIENPNDALKPDVSARIAVTGMRDGMFTGRKLSDYNFPNDLDLPAKENPRRIVNGVDGSDNKVAAYHREFAEALMLAGWGGSDVVSDRVKKKFSIIDLFKLSYPK